ncbi:hypothetical protein ElyMa_005304900 [Elysia marginata]|uniref:Uncharacterized protein n=1 Tax=Elysia marginata TaxID=1093978 RepID=A0AAV4JYC0_9GAST|nr:hypothetical protein ElyMa_005304900 [Elysia marginata]
MAATATATIISCRNVRTRRSPQGAEWLVLHEALCMRTLYLNKGGDNGKMNPTIFFRPAAGASIGTLESNSQSGVNVTMATSAIWGTSH